MKEAGESFLRLIDIMDKLRIECPWDKKQTLESIRTLTIEETYELSDAILSKDMVDIKKELGDILLHIVFYSKIASETNAFNVKDVIDGICEKLIFRHPHVFSTVDVEDSKEVESNWEQLKLKEKGGNKTVLAGVPKSLPALVKANRIQQKVKAVGFDWEDKSQVWDKVREELSELISELENKANNPAEYSKDKVEAEFGDLFFSLVNAARLFNVNPEDALERTNIKFTKRFNHLEKRANEMDRSLHDMSLDEMDVIWEEAKKFD